jgi:hypothetical protein
MVPHLFLDHGQSVEHPEKVTQARSEGNACNPVYSLPILPFPLSLLPLRSTGLFVTP